MAEVVNETQVAVPDYHGKPRGRLRNIAELLRPTTLVAGRVAIARDADGRVRRVASTAADRVRERVRRSRPRMRSLVVAPGGRLSWRAVPTPPDPGPHGAVVHPLAIATCDMDRPIGLGATPFPLPLQFGHECVAEVVAVGGEVQAVRPGQRVVVPFQINCGHCTACREGRTGNCLTVPPISMYGFGLAGGLWGGALADELAVPYADAMLVPLPDGVDPAAAASVADNVSDAYRLVAPDLPVLLERDPDAELLIVGAVSRRSLFTASVSLYAGLVARALGARNVLLADARGFVRAHAERLGLPAIEPKELRGRKPTRLVADISASPNGLRTAVECVAPDGVCRSAGSLHAMARIPTVLMYGRNVTLHIARSHARAMIPKVLELVTAGVLRPESVTTVQAPLDDAPSVLRDHLLGASTKTVLTAA